MDPGNLAGCGTLCLLPPIAFMAAVPLAAVAMAFQGYRAKHKDRAPVRSRRVATLCLKSRRRPSSVKLAPLVYPLLRDTVIEEATPDRSWSPEPVQRLKRFVAGPCLAAKWLRFSAGGRDGQDEPERELGKHVGAAERLPRPPVCYSEAPFDAGKRDGRPGGHASLEQEEPTTQCDTGTREHARLVVAEHARTEEALRATAQLQMQIQPAQS